MMVKKVEKNMADNVPSMSITDDGVAVKKANDSASKPAPDSPLPKLNKDTRKWYIGIVRPRHEKKIVEQLKELGIESFAAIHPEIRMWSQGRKRRVDVVVIPSKIFIHCTNKERHRILGLHIGVLRFLVNISGKVDEFKCRPLAIVPNIQVENFQKLLRKAQILIEFSEFSIVKGDQVRITSGVLKGIKGIVCNGAQGKTKLYINLEGLGSAFTEVDVSDIEIIH